MQAQRLGCAQLQACGGRQCHLCRCVGSRGHCVSHGAHDLLCPDPCVPILSSPWSPSWSPMAQGGAMSVLQHLCPEQHVSLVALLPPHPQLLWPPRHLHQVMLFCGSVVFSPFLFVGCVPVGFFFNLIFVSMAISL